MSGSVGSGGASAWARRDHASPMTTGSVAGGEPARGAAGVRASHKRAGASIIGSKSFDENEIPFFIASIDHADPALEVFAEGGLQAAEAVGLHEHKLAARLLARLLEVGCALLDLDLL